VRRAEAVAAREAWAARRAMMVDVAVEVGVWWV
jgi:hypothetical protein